jgi:oxygen-independent coproporphyrinogen III oxidase
MTLDVGKILIGRGFMLDQDDLLRRWVIMELLYRFAVDIGAIERRHQIEFWRYFVPESTKLEAMQADGLIEFEQNATQAQQVGKLLIRTIGMVFDRYLREKQIQRYSKVI